MGKFFGRLGKTQNATIALKVAARWRREVSKEDRSVTELTLEDFYRLVTFHAL